MSVLEIALTVFVVVLIVLSIILTVYVVKFLKELTLTMTSIKELTDLIQKELTPALKALNKVLGIVQKISSVTNGKLAVLKSVLTGLLGASCLAFTNIKSKGGFLSGLISGFNMFRKK